jgi:type III secretion protein U
VAKSQDVGATALLIMLFAFFMARWDGMYEKAQELVLIPSQFITQPLDRAYPQVVAAIVSTMAAICMPFLAIILIGGIAANYFQVGAMFVLEPIKPDLKKLNADGRKS